jgi:hypothetical protein
MTDDRGQKAEDRCRNAEVGMLAPNTKGIAHSETKRGQKKLQVAKYAIFLIGRPPFGVKVNRSIFSLYNKVVLFSYFQVSGW